MKTTGTPLNTNNEANVGEVSVNSNTAQTLVEANEKRIGLIISNRNNQDLWVRFYPVGVDNDQRGFVVYGDTTWEMNPEDKYTGEVSVIMNNGGTKTINYTEY
jgi:hypothetical protein